MNRGVCKSVAPRRSSAVEVCSRVNGDFLIVNPQVHVELVGVGGAGGEVGAVEEGAGVGGAEEIDSSIGKGFIAKSAKIAKILNFFLRVLSVLRGKKILAKPIDVFIPWTRFEEEFFFGDVPAQLQQRTVVGEIAVVERQDERAVVGAVVGHLASLGVDEAGEVFDGGRNRGVKRIGELEIV